MSKQMIIKISLIVFTFVYILGLGGCNSPKLNSGNFNLISRTTLFAVSDIGPMDITASCSRGEKLIGGGYALTQPVLDQGDYLIVEASYPSAQNDWTVTVFNPDSTQDGPNSRKLVRVDAYCIATRSFDVGIKIVQSPTQTIMFDQETTVTAQCPENTVVMGGGYKTDHSVTYAGLYNAWLVAAAPALDSADVATGWRITQYVISWSPPPSLPTTIAYAICATENLTAGVTRKDNISPVDSLGFTYYEGQVTCRPEEFTAGGGYEFAGDNLVPHHNYFNRVVDDFSAWGVETIYGFNTGSTTNVKGWALCVETPHIALAVRITSPEETILPASASNTGVTEPITFTALATDGAGTPATGVTYAWSDNGNSFGTSGATFSATLTAGECSPISHQISVTATDADGNSATDVITILAGTVC